MVLPMQNVVVSQTNNSPFNLAMKHVNTLENGDQIWMKSFAFIQGIFGENDINIAWGTAGENTFFVRATDVGQQSFDEFPTLVFGNSPAQENIVDDSKVSSPIAYNATKRDLPQVIMAGVTPAIIDLADTSFDIATIIRPGVKDIQNVLLRQGGNALFSIAMKKNGTLSNGDEIWVSTFVFERGAFGTTSLPIVWGDAEGEFSIQVIDEGQQTSAIYPILKSGDFPAQ